MSAVKPPNTRQPRTSIHFRPEFRADPFAGYAQLRELGAPIVWLARHSIWAVSRYEPVRAVLNDWKRFSNAGRRWHQETTFVEKAVAAGPA